MGSEAHLQQITAGLEVKTLVIVQARVKPVAQDPIKTNMAALSEPWDFGEDG